VVRYLAFSPRELAQVGLFSARQDLSDRLLARWKPRFYEQPFQMFSDHVSRLLGALHWVTGSALIVDSSKSPTYAYLLRTLPSVDLYVMHLVRDSRAVAFSMLRPKLRLEHRDQVVYLERMSATRVALKWLSWNLAAIPFTRQPDRVRRVRYEDFVADPAATLRHIGQWLSLDRELPDLDGSTVRLSANHHINGNPVRFLHGRVALHEDDEWKVKMQPSDRWLVTLLTWPLLARYGYLR